MPDITWQPTQLRAARSTANILVFGGEAGGGKTRFIIQYFANAMLQFPGFQGVIFRRTTPEIHGAGSLWEESQEVFRPIPGATARESPTFEWRLGRSLVEFRPMQYESDIYAHQGKQYGGIAFDEGTRFTANQIWYLMGSRNRNATAPDDFVPFTILTVNPDPDSPIKKLIEWWLDAPGQYPRADRDGVLRWFVRSRNGEIFWADTPDQLPAESEPRSMTFIRSRLSDNQALLKKDPGYRSRLETLLPHERARLLKGDWLARPTQGDFFQRGWFRELGDTDLNRRLKKHPSLERDMVKVVRCWDLAATPVKGCLVPGVPRPPGFIATEKEADWTRGVKLGLFRGRDVVVLDMVSCRDTPGAVDELIRETARRDGPTTVIGLPQDPGQAGVDQLERKKKDLRGLGRVIGLVRSRNKEFYARPVATYAYQRRVWFKLGAWNADFFNEIETFPPQERYQHDDVVDAFADAFRLVDTLPRAYGYDPVRDVNQDNESKRLEDYYRDDDPVIEDRIRATVGFGRRDLL